MAGRFFLPFTPVGKAIELRAIELKRGTVIRTCRHEIEDEAYAVVTALLMPYRPLFAHVNAGLPIDELATPAPVSRECRLFRVKRAGLWRTYKARRNG